MVSFRGVKAGRGRPVNNQRSVCTESTRIVHYGGYESSVILLAKRRQMGSHDARAQTPQTQMRIRDLTYTKSAYIYIYTYRVWRKLTTGSPPLGVRHWESATGSPPLGVRLRFRSRFPHAPDPQTSYCSPGLLQPRRCSWLQPGLRSLIPPERNKPVTPFHPQ